MIKKLIISSVFCGLLVMSFMTTTFAEAPLPDEPLVVKTSWSKEEVKQIAEFYEKKYKVTNLVKTVACESSYKFDAVNMKDSHRLSKGSWGAAQFSKETFMGYAKEMGETYDDPLNPYQALDVMGYMFSKGKQSHWTCYKKVVGV